MEFQDDIKRIEEDVKEIKQDVKKLMIFMAVSKAEDAKNNKYTAAIVAVVCSVASSGIMLYITKMVGG
jgi:hypothetical protein